MAVDPGFCGAAEGEAPVLLDVTRLVALRWGGRPATGIDRICLAYLAHYAGTARAVVQHRGVIRMLGAAASRRLFAWLAAPSRGIRLRLGLALAAALARGERPRPGSLYVNAGHTDYDLPAHVGWVARHRLRAIYLIHDLIPIRHPDHCRPHAVRRHTGRVASALRHGAGIVVGSEAVARDLAAHAREARLRCPPVVVAPLAGAELPRVEPGPAAGDYFLCVGTIESRKNHALLLAVWERLCAAQCDPPRLVIAGRWGTGADGVRAALAASAMAGGRITIVEACDDAALAALMQGARAMLMPSLAEGFGLPMAEALALGIPVIASDLPCFREVGQGIPCLLDPHDVAGWTARIAGFDRAAAQRQRRIDALRGYRPPRWDQHFAQVDAWLTTLTRPAAPADAAPGPGRRPRAGRRLDLGTAR